MGRRSVRILGVLAVAVGLACSGVGPAAGSGLPPYRPPDVPQLTPVTSGDTPPSAVWSTERVGAGLRTAWSRSDADMYENVTETDGVVATSDRTDTHVLGLDGSTGAVRWSVAEPAGSQMAAASDGRFFVQNPYGDPSITALDAATGATLWTVTQPGSWVETLADGRLLVTLAPTTTPPFTIEALDPATGRVLWSRDGFTEVTGAAGKVYGIADDLADPPNGSVSGLGPTTGATLWTTDLPQPPAGWQNSGSPYEQLPLSSGRFLIRTFSNPPVDRVYDGSTGAQVWAQYMLGWTAADNYQVPGPEQATSAGGVLYEASGTLVWALDEATGQAIWKSGNGLAVGGAPTVSADVVMFDCQSPQYTDARPWYVCSFDKRTGQPLDVTYVGTWDQSGQAPVLAGDDAYVRDTQGLTALTPATPAALPGRVEAETTLSQVLTGPATDTGGGLLVGLFPPGGAILDYPVSVAAAGRYTVTFRVASDGASLTPPIDPSLQLQLLGVGTLATVVVPQTGGWQAWQSVSTTVTLPAGVHRLRIYVPAGAQAFNINWFDVEPATSSAARTARALPRPATATARRSSCEAGLRPSARLSRAAIEAACAVA